MATRSKRKGGVSKQGAKKTARLEKAIDDEGEADGGAGSDGGEAEGGADINESVRAVFKLASNSPAHQELLGRVVEAFAKIDDSGGEDNTERQRVMIQQLGYAMSQSLPADDDEDGDDGDRVDGDDGDRVDSDDKGDGVYALGGAMLGVMKGGALLQSSGGMRFLHKLSLRDNQRAVETTVDLDDMRRNMERTFEECHTLHEEEYEGMLCEYEPFVKKETEGGEITFKEYEAFVIATGGGLNRQVSTLCWRAQECVVGCVMSGLVCRGRGYSRWTWSAGTCRRRFVSDPPVSMAECKLMLILT